MTYEWVECALHIPLMSGSVIIESIILNFIHVVSVVKVICQIDPGAPIHCGSESRVGHPW